MNLVLAVLAALHGAPAYGELNPAIVDFRDRKLNRASPLWESLDRKTEILFKIIDPHHLIAAMGIGKKMTLLDIGGGTGTYSLLMAQKLAGTGKVYSTDIMPDAVSIMSEKARKLGLKNFFPVEVVPEGLDPFYSRHKFDRIFLIHSFINIVHNGPEYFAGLRKALTGRGRIVVFTYHGLNGFQLDDFTDFPGLLDRLSEASLQGPVFGKLSPTTRRGIARSRTCGCIEPSESLKMSILSDFNRLLREPRLFEAFGSTESLLSGDLYLLREESLYMRKILMGLQDEGFIFAGKSPEEFNSAERGYLHFLNKILLIQEFRELLYGGVAPYLPDGAAKFRRISHVTRIMNKAGLELESASFAFPFRVLLVFRNAN